MTLGIILYILLFFVSVFISIMYLEFGAMALMGLMVTIPVCMFLFLLVLRKRVSVSVDSKNPLAEKDAIDKPARAAITLSVENKSRLLPVTKGIAKVRYENPFSGDKGKMKIRFSVDTGKKRDRRIPVVMDNCGNVSITVEKVRIYDLRGQSGNILRRRMFSSCRRRKRCILEKTNGTTRRVRTVTVFPLIKREMTHLKFLTSVSMRTEIRFREFTGS